MACKSDGTEILTGSERGEITRWGANNNQLAQYRCGDGSILSVGWSPDGTKFAGVGSDNHVYVVEAASGEVRIVADLGTPPAVGEGDALAWVGWSPDGKYLATVGWDAKVRTWEGIPNTSKSKFVLEGHSESLYCGAWSPDGKKLASAGREICIWDTESGTLLQTFGKRESNINSLAWNSDNRYIASGDSQGVINVWDTETGKEIAQIQTTLDDIRAVAWFENYLLYGGKNSHRWIVPIAD
jgi:WD40 repeat protein